MENQHRLITGYSDLPQTDIDRINAIKSCGVELGKMWKLYMDETNANGRWMSIARTHFEEGFSAFVRAIAKPTERF